MALWLNNIFGGSQNGLKKKVSTDIDMERVHKKQKNHYMCEE